MSPLFRTKGDNDGGSGDGPSFVLPIVDSLDLSCINGDNDGKDVSQFLTRSMNDDEKQWMDIRWQSYCIVQFTIKQQENNKKTLKYDFTIKARILLRLASKHKIVIKVQSEFLQNSG